MYLMTLFDLFEVLIAKNGRKCNAIPLLNIVGVFHQKQDHMTKTFELSKREVCEVFKLDF